MLNPTADIRKKIPLKRTKRWIKSYRYILIKHRIRKILNANNSIKRPDKKIFWCDTRYKSSANAQQSRTKAVNNRACHGFEGQVTPPEITVFFWNLRPRLHWSGQMFAPTNFFPGPPVYMDPCKFCYRLQWCLHGSLQILRGWLHGEFQPPALKFQPG